MANHQLSKKELVQGLKEQVYFLDVLLTNFSKHDIVKEYKNKKIGYSNIEISTDIEAKIIATVIRTLLHDTDKSQSLLKQIGLKDEIKYINTAPPNDGYLHSMTGLHGVRRNSSNQYFGLVAKVKNGDNFISVPLYLQHLESWYSNYHKLRFEDWWDKIVIIDNGCNLSRQDIILITANKDGGAHIDERIPLGYHNVKQSRLSLNILGVDTSFERSTILSSIAQIGWEVLNSIDIND